MSCCQCEGIEREFDQRIARKDLKRYRRKGLRRTSRLVVEALESEGIDGMSLLDIGGGIGGIQLELMKRGVSRATGVDASSAYLQAARREAARIGFGGRIDHVHGDFVRLADQIERADIVTLDRVICCYDDMPALVDASAAHARKLYALVYPQNAWWTEMGVAAANLLLRIRKNPMRTFMHETRAVDAIVRDHGFGLRFHRLTPIWQVAVYGR